LSGDADPSIPASKERLRRLRILMLTAIRRGNRGLFQQTLIDLGQKPGSSEFERSMKMFEDYQRAKR
jgi:hypothetical protein